MKRRRFVTLTLGLAATAAFVPVGASDALAAAGDGAGLASQSVYPTIDAGQSVKIFMQVRNTGGTTWTSGAGYGYDAREGWTSWGRRPIWRDVRPGETLTFEETVRPPAQAGRYRYGFVMTHNGRGFGPYFYIDVTVRESQPATKRLSVPPVSQMAPTTIIRPGKPNETRSTGQNNCGPASVAMAIQFYKGSGAINVDTAAKAIRGFNKTSITYDARGNRIDGNTTTSFKTSQTDTLLGSHGLKRVDVNSFEAVKQQIAQGHPVIVLVSNGAYIRTVGRTEVPYPNTSDWVQTHIVVVTGYDQDNIYINDPLANTTGVKDFRVPNAAFKAAAGAHNWFASAILTS